MRIPPDVRQAHGSPSPGVPYRAVPVEDVVTATGRSRDEIMGLLSVAMSAKLVRRVDDPQGGEALWVMEADEPLTDDQIRSLLLENQVFQDFLPGAQVSHVLVPTSAISREDYVEVRDWVQRHFGEVVEHTFPADSVLSGPGVEGHVLDWRGTRSIFKVPTQELDGS